MTLPTFTGIAIDVLVIVVFYHLLMKEITREVTEAIGKILSGADSKEHETFINDMNKVNEKRLTVIKTAAYAVTLTICHLRKIAKTTILLIVILQLGTMVAGNYLASG